MQPTAAPEYTYTRAKRNSIVAFFTQPKQFPECLSGMPRGPQGRCRAMPPLDNGTVGEVYSRAEARAPWEQTTTSDGTRRSERDIVLFGEVVGRRGGGPLLGWAAALGWRPVALLLLRGLVLVAL